MVQCGKVHFFHEDKFFFYLLIILANNLDPCKIQLKVGSHLEPNCWMVFLK